MSCTIALMAALSSGPLVSSRIVLPMVAASIITASMLRALARWPLHTSDTLHLNCEARRTICAEARACKPRRLVIFISRVCMIETANLVNGSATATPDDGLPIEQRPRDLVPLRCCADVSPRHDAG